MIKVCWKKNTNSFVSLRKWELQSYYATAKIIYKMVQLLYFPYSIFLKAFSKGADIHRISTTLSTLREHHFFLSHWMDIHTLSWNWEVFGGFLWFPYGRKGRTLGASESLVLEEVDVVSEERNNGSELVPTETDSDKGIGWWSS